MHCHVAIKIVYPVAKNRVYGACKVSDISYAQILDSFNKGYSSDLNIWTLTDDDYIVLIKRDGGLNTDSSIETEFFCFICS